MTSTLEATLRSHLLRSDGDEDLTLASYSTSSGRSRETAILTHAILPRPGERTVHGNVEFTGEYVLRAASEAATRSEGIAILHSHPDGRGWQGLSSWDIDAESSFANLAAAVTGRPLVGMTLAGRDSGWSARAWENDAMPEWMESVRVVGSSIHVFWNPRLRPPPQSNGSQLRTISAWGAEVQSNICRLRVLVVGVGSVGLDVAQRLAATGLLDVGVMDMDIVKDVNLDRMIGATRADAVGAVLKVDVARRLMDAAATSKGATFHPHAVSLTTSDGLRTALDYDVIISCVDRPWPRAVLNTLAYSDLIPVIDGGINIDTFDDGTMRGATWRVHTLVPERPCMACNGQLVMGDVQLDRQGLLDDPEYIKRTGRKLPSSQNVALLCASVSAGELAQFVSLVATPGGMGVPSAQRYILAPHIQEAMNDKLTQPHCRFEMRIGEGDARPRFTD